MSVKFTSTKFCNPSYISIYYSQLITAIKKNNPNFKLTSDYYKNVFRNSQEYKIAYNLICDEIKNYNTIYLIYHMYKDSQQNDTYIEYILFHPF